MRGQPAHQAGQPAGVVEVLHQVSRAARPDVGEHRHLAADAIEVVERHRAGVAGATRHRDEMDDRVGRAAHRHRDDDAVQKRRLRQELAWREIGPDQLDHAPTARRGHARMAGIGGRDRRGTGQRQADRLGKAHHGRGGAHRHAGAVAARDAALDAEPFGLVDLAGAPLVPELPGVGAGAEDLAAIVAAQHRPGRQIDAGQAGAEGTHQEARRGLVAAAHQHRAVDRMAAQQLLGLHCEQVAIEHGGRPDEGFGERDRRQLDRQAAGLQHAALDVVDALPEVAVTRVDVGPGVDDRDHRLADPVVGRVAHLHQARAVAEAAQVVGREPARAAQRIVGAACHVACGLATGAPSSVASKTRT